MDTFTPSKLSAEPRIVSSTIELLPVVFGPSQGFYSLQVPPCLFISVVVQFHVAFVAEGNHPVVSNL